MTRYPGPTGNAPRKDPPHVTRRVLVFGGLVLGGAAVLGGGVFAARWYNIGSAPGDGALTAPEAFRRAEAGEILLVDIRRPDEWAATGVPRGAVPLDMRRADFSATLSAALGGDRTRPVALICARGVRSSRMADRMGKAGFTTVLDVPEGLLGSGAGPGWLNRGLPVELP
ncbi:molybdopterin biosynthesis protein MoeB [Sulfitobacter sp. THAF37]|uniref:rhodanese-like domain-containing protein n=1 Tax=Sulfitobacter sp. THAF37 TaxID=2587855 RepID=UPI0012686970|nr:rhodanese-like domain-containing protein [Sulfitobacter sp. THAF37]QFT57559.1 molybdopterin biosynthesis protein MoeB [Sulfitobacter sp. THAF37]